MPWCTACDRFLSPPTVTSDGRCPTCGRPVEPGGAHPPAADGGEDQPAEEELPPIPFHMKLLGASLVVYLGYRFFQGIEWLVHRLS